MDTLIFIIVFVFGTIIGSFINVLTLRYNTGLFKKDRSECFSCGKTLEFLDLIPVLSFLFLHGRCRYCRSKISIQYLLVELFTGLVFLLVYLKVGVINFDLFFYFLVWSIFIAIFVYDLKHKIIPDGLVYTLIILSLIKIFPININEFLLLAPSSWTVLAGPIAAAPFAFFWLISGGKWMGFGDAKLAFAMGWLLGLGGVISAITLAFWVGAATGLILVLVSKLNSLSRLFKNLTIKSEIPFAPFLIIGTALVFFTEINILNISFF
ncbi:MAG TPA: prepilin peptidase [Candidatus Paceibacterota bacterium]|nr:hypothetical protein [Parcubacteria group bacterium]MDP6119527.1 prepilin peptidase [Candidatus Paceibacterota bacterium]HJN62873.1 prepilin peptidase [Candidatus Paceibacterota bacterium]|tara:strand:- start:2438 stop:3235 length:798 start_codon:yes stop_codon:yes gene_type:complete